MGEITIGALRERNFSNIDNYHSISFDEVTIGVYAFGLSFRVEIGGVYEYNDDYTIPNCKTLEQLDQLIKMFKID